MAIKENVDLIGLSGLITPSLDEMCFVASELKRNNITKPLLIGGATTSKIHTAIKIDPLYDSGVCHVTDASKAVAVASNLISKNKVKPFIDSLAKEYSSLRGNYFKKKKSSLNNLENCRKNMFQFNWSSYKPPIPKIKQINFQQNISIKKISKFIDWNPFFEAWELYGKFPKILEDEIIGKAASDLWKDAQKMLNKITKEKLTKPKAVIGFWPANSVGDDIVIFDEKNKVEISRLFFLRQQVDRSKSERANFCLADFIAPTSTNIEDHIGGFIVTAGEGIEKLAKYYEDKNDDYNSILVKSLGDRIAEALAEMLHRDVRTKFWGYSNGENFSNDQLISEEYIGIRPAPGYPACPDHTEKETLFKLLKADENIKDIIRTLAWLLEFHQRENKPTWWRLFDRLGLTEIDLYDDMDCLVGLQRTDLDPFLPTPRSKNKVFEYAFDPNQPFKGQTRSFYILGEDKTKVTATNIDQDKGLIKLQSKIEPDVRLSLLPDDFVRPAPIPEAIKSVIEKLLANNFAPSAITDFLFRRKPRFVDGPKKNSLAPARFPWYNNYENWQKELRNLGKDYTIIPEYRISELMPTYKELGSFGTVLSGALRCL